MGRQVGIHAHPDDLPALQAFMGTRQPITILTQPTPTAELVPTTTLDLNRVAWPVRDWGELLIGRDQDLPLLRQQFVERQN